ncbi:MerC domain-containing protein [Tamlana crocina]|uniref:MerC domain-containing protein n=1 Tax=Tamlana crocina TaxID=393006 RepID=UPI001FD73557|nr:MerC domain-containing protein [Tamlana crocina]
MASSLCLVHCLATPFLFTAQASAICCHSNAPTWWYGIDFVFLIISFFAIYRSAKNSTSPFIKKGLWVCWSFLFVLIVNERLEWLHLSKLYLYATAISLVVLHLYNLKYCQCKKGLCCSFPR